MSAVDWHDDANCRGRADEFMPAKGTPMHVKLCKAICATCPVKRVCLDWAMGQEAGLTADFRVSVLGGLTPTERYQLAQSGRFRRQAKAGAR